MVRLVEVKAKPGYRLWLRYEDGVEGEINLSNLVGQGVFSYWNDPKNFELETWTRTPILRWKSLQNRYFSFRN